MKTSELEKRLQAVIDRAGLSLDRQKVARYTVGLLVREVERLLKEELREAKFKRGKNRE